MASPQDLSSPFLARSVAGTEPLRMTSGNISTPISTSQSNSTPEVSPTQISSGLGRHFRDDEKFRKELTERGVILVREVDHNFLEEVVWPFAKLSADSNCNKIRLLIDSPGGYITEMFQLISMIRNSQKPVIAEVIRAFSAAFMIATQCHERVAYQGSEFMYHLPWTIAFGNQEQIDEQTKYLRAMTTYGESLVQQRTRIDAETLKSYRHRDWWMTAKEALRHGVIDRIHEEEVYALSPEFVQERIRVEKKMMEKLEVRH